MKKILKRNFFSKKNDLFNYLKITHEESVSKLKKVNYILTIQNNLPYNLTKIQLFNDLNSVITSEDSSLQNNIIKFLICSIIKHYKKNNYILLLSIDSLRDLSHEKINCLKIKEEKGINILIEILNNISNDIFEDKSLQNTLCELIFSIIWNLTIHIETKNIILNDAFEIVYSIITKNKKIDIVSSGLPILTNFADDDNGRKKMDEKNSVGLIFDILDQFSEDNKIVIKCFETLFNLSNSYENKLKIMNKIDLIQKYINSDEDIVGNLIGILSNCSSIVEFKNIIFKNLDFEKIFTVIKKFKIFVLFALLILSLSLDKEIKKKFIEINFFKKICEKCFKFFLEIENVEMDLIFYKEDFENSTSFIDIFSNDNLIYEIIVYLFYFCEYFKKFNDFIFNEQTKKIFLKNFKSDSNIQKNLFDILKENNRFDIFEFEKIKTMEKKRKRSF
jgi:hypothetical protein